MTPPERDRHRARAQKQTQARALAERAFDDLVEAFTSGDAQTVRHFLVFTGRFPDKSADNIRLIYKQRPDATHVEGYRTWLKLGRQVQRGQKGIVIFAPRVGARDGHEEPAEHTTTAASPERVVQFRAVHVFDVSQTEGPPLPERQLAGGLAGATTRLLSVLTAHDIALDYRPQLPGGALGTSLGGRIVLRTGLSPAGHFSVLVHELAHELLHHASPRPSARVRETEAEAVAFSVCHAVGIETNHTAAEYIHSYGGDADTLRASLGRIQRTAALLITAAMPPQEKHHHLELPEPAHTPVTEREGDRDEEWEREY